MRPTAQDLRFLQPEISETDAEALKSGPRRVYSQNLEEISFLIVGPVFVQLDNVAKIISLCTFYYDLDEMEKRSENYSLQLSIYPDALPKIIYMNKQTKFLLTEKDLTIKTPTNTYKLMPITDKLWTEVTGIKEPWKTSFEKYMNGNTSEED